VVVAHDRTQARVGRVIRAVGKNRRIRRHRRSARFPKCIGRAPPREEIHPGAKAAFVTVGMAVLQHAVEHGLHEILRGGAVTRQLHEKTKQRAVVPLEQLAQRIEFAGADGEHEGMVGALIGGFHGRRASGTFKHAGRRRDMDFFERGDHGGLAAWRWFIAENRAARERLHSSPASRVRRAGRVPGCRPRCRVPLHQAGHPSR
jgi:hypothetical protein